MRAAASGCRDSYSASYQVIQQKPRSLNYKFVEYPFARRCFWPHHGIRRWVY